MLDWNQQPNQPTPDEALPHEGPYPAPDRNCYVCDQRAWIWNGEGYECGSGDPAHPKRIQWLRETFPSQGEENV